LRPLRGNPHLVRIQHGRVKQLLNLPNFDLRDSGLLATKLHQLKITTLHSHGLVDYDAKAPLYFANLAKRIKADMVVDIHDYKVICPRINLVKYGYNSIYCGEPPEIECDKCLNDEPNDFGVTSIREWREDHYRSLLDAKTVIVPSKDTLIRLQKYYPLVNFEFHPHGSSVFTVSDTPQGGNDQIPRIVRVIIIGAISTIKGFNILLESAKWAKVNQQKICFVVLGYTLNDKLLESYGVEITGRYSDADADGLLENLKPDLIWFPAIWPETYSYTLDIAMKSNIPIVAFNIGAIAERLMEFYKQKYLLIPLSEFAFPVKINSSLIEFSQSQKRIMGTSTEVD